MFFVVSDDVSKMMMFQSLFNPWVSPGVAGEYRRCEVEIEAGTGGPVGKNMGFNMGSQKQLTLQRGHEDVPSLKLTYIAHENPNVSWVSYHQNGGFSSQLC